jgi:AcrR family transcriptional regulator
MARKNAPTTDSRVPLNRERVLRAALDFADEHGLEALSMRKLAQELGVEAMSLYNHVENKDDIVGGMIGLVVEEIEVPAVDLDWKAGFAKDVTYHAYHVWQGYALGFTLQELNFPHDRESLKAMAARFLRDFPTDEFPFLAEHIEQHVDPPHAEHESAFELWLDLILDSLERLRDAV